MKYLNLILILSLLLFSCNENSNSPNLYEAKISESQTVNLLAQNDLTVENTNGTITVIASDSATNIYLDIVKKVASRESQNDAQSHLQDIDISITQNASNVGLEVDHPMNTDRTYQIDLNIMMPNDFNYSLSLGNGNIDLQTRTKTMNINLGNGNVNTDVTLKDSCHVRINLGNGNISFTIPGNTNSELFATVGNGTITNNGLNFQNQQSSNNQFVGTLGGGSGDISLILGNGNILMNRK